MHKDVLGLTDLLPKTNGMIKIDTLTNVIELQLDKFKVED